MFVHFILILNSIVGLLLTLWLEDHVKLGIELNLAKSLSKFKGI